jgi:hypothetical protein
MIRRRSHRSTHTPANGPTTRAGTALASRAPLTAAGAHGWPLAILVAIHSITVIRKTMSPTTETDWPSHNRRQFRFCRKPGAGGSVVI